MKLNLPPMDEDDEIDITPMIDCVFLLVLFFMVTSSFVDEPKMEPVPYTLRVPGDEGKTVTLSVEGTYTVRDATKDTEIATLAELVRLFRDDPNREYRLETRAKIRLADDTKVEDATVLPLTLPTAEKPTTIRRDQADLLTVPREGGLRFKDAAGERSFKEGGELVAALSKRPADLRKRPVILRCDAKSSYQQVVQARNALRLAGVELIFEEIEVRNANP